MFRLPTTRTLLCSLASVLIAAPTLFAQDGSSLKKLDRPLRSAVLNGTPALQPVIIRAKPGQLASVKDWLKSRKAVVDSEITGLDAVATKLSAAS